MRRLLFLPLVPVFMAFGLLMMALFIVFGPIMFLLFGRRRGFRRMMMAKKRWGRWNDRWSDERFVPRAELETRLTRV